MILHWSFNGKIFFVLFTGHHMRMGHLQVLHLIWLQNTKNINNVNHSHPLHCVMGWTVGNTDTLTLPISSALFVWFTLKSLLCNSNTLPTFALMTGCSPWPTHDVHLPSASNSATISSPIKPTHAQFMTQKPQHMTQQHKWKENKNSMMKTTEKKK